MPRKADDSPVIQMKVTLKHSKPPIWRRIQIRGSVSLYRLHQAIQLAMGWYDSHLHQFIINREYYGEPHPDYFGFTMKNEQRFKLGQFVEQGTKRFVYEYDFGDSWEHEILIEKVLPVAEGVRYPRCIAGKRACPPEDVGGVWGYATFLEALRDRKHPDHEMYSEWIGGAFDAEAFDLDEVNESLKAW